jgi:hypothetical protein
MKRFSLILFIAITLSYIAYSRTDGFSPSLIEGPLFTQHSPPPTSEVQAILSQPFHYLDKGRQCFVFESEDHKYVLKFFNQSYFRLPWYSFLAPREKTKRALRHHFYEHSYEIAFRELGEQILYLHLGPAKGCLPILALKDKAKQKREIDLNATPFVLQRKGSPFYEGLTQVYEKEGLEGLYREIDRFVGAVATRIEKKIADGDHDVEHNWGYVNGEIFHLDPGRLYYDEQLTEPNRLKDEWRAATHSFHKWLTKHYPEAATHLETLL